MGAHDFCLERFHPHSANSVVLLPPAVTAEQNADIGFTGFPVFLSKPHWPWWQARCAGRLCLSSVLAGCVQFAHWRDYSSGVWNCWEITWIIFLTLSFLETRALPCLVTQTVKHWLPALLPVSVHIRNILWNTNPSYSETVWFIPPVFWFYISHLHLM